MMQGNDGRKNSKKVLIPMYLLGLLIIGSLGFSWWGGLVNDPDSATKDSPGIVVGEGEAVSTEINLGDIANATGKKLVPEGRVNQSVGGAEANTESYTFEIPVTWKEEDGNGMTQGVTGIITATAGPVTTSSSGGADLINVDVATGQSITLDGAAVNVPVTVTMDEPATKDAYEAIKDATITFDVTVSVAKN
ncbi:MAG: hypothetical protein Q4E76_06335 [Tissierellia bacterium]|nr:hypothetical protein [Tissierellia bacterium]